MISLSLNDFLKLTSVRAYNVPDALYQVSRLKGVSTDSRTIEPDQIFWAIKGERFDGHNFVHEAGSKALCCVVEQKRIDNLKREDIPMFAVPDTLKALQELALIQRKKVSIPLLAITGSNGKTTTKEMVSHILQTKMNILKTKGNLNNHIGCPLTLLQLNEMHEAAVLELGINHFGEIKTLVDIVKPNRALITLIGDTHLEFLRSREGVAKEKLTLFDNLEEGSVIFKNMDDPFIAPYEKSAVQFVTYGFGRGVDVKGTEKKLDINGCATFFLNGKTKITLQVPGLHNMRNALAAAAVATEQGFSDEEIASALSTYAGFEKRMQIIEWNDARIVNDTYNASPDSVKLALDTLAGMKHKGKIILALGDMFELGDKSLALHTEILEYASKLDPGAFFVVGQNMKQAVKKLDRKAAQIIVCRDLNQMADQLAGVIGKGDIILLKGSRGMQMEKVIGLLP